MKSFKKELTRPQFSWLTIAAVILTSVTLLIIREIVESGWLS